MAINEKLGRGSDRTTATRRLGAAAPRIRPDIVSAATQLFSERGYHAASMQDIADASGMRKPSLYHHVRRKEDLLLEIHEQLIDGLIAETTEVLSGCRSPSDRLRAVLRVAMHLVADHRDEVTVFLSERHTLTGARWDAIVAKRDIYERMVVDVIAAGIRERAFVKLDAGIATRGVLAMAFWGHTWFQAGGKRTADEVANLFADIALRGLETRP